MRTAVVLLLALLVMQSACALTAVSDKMVVNSQEMMITRPPPAYCCMHQLETLNDSQKYDVQRLMQQDVGSDACCALVPDPATCRTCVAAEIDSYRTPVAPAPRPWYENVVKSIFLGTLFITPLFILLLVANGIVAALRGVGFLSRGIGIICAVFAIVGALFILAVLFLRLL